MRIPPWNPQVKPQPEDLVQAVELRRGGQLLNLDRALLWSEPLARGWNTYLKAVRTELSAPRELRELAICAVALLTGARYEYHHHAPDYLQAGGRRESLDALARFVAGAADALSSLTPDESMIVRYAVQMTRSVTVDDDLFEQLRRRFETTQLVEITAAIATYNMVARFLVALDVSPES